jgi:hypothetical protein
MIIPGKTRGDGKQLADYLLNDPKNDSATLLESRGFEPGDLEDQLVGHEQETLANTRAKSAFYFAAFRAAPGEELTREQALWGIARLEKKLGFEGLPRAIVAHVFHGEEHLHVVWGRYDRETGKVREARFDARARLEVAAEMEERFGLRTLDRDGLDDRGHARQWEDGQDERAAKAKGDRVEEITRLWNTTDSGKAFRAGLEQAGYTLAHGKSRAYCVVDENGEVHSLARQIKGVKTADVKARLADLDPASIPEADTIKDAIKQAQKDRAGPEAKKTKTPRQSRTDKRAALAADAAEIAAARDDPDYGGDPHIPTPRERSDAERQASAGMAAAILERVTWDRSTFTRSDLEREAAKMTGHTGRESWMAQSGGLGALDDQHRASAERSYDRWAEEKPRLAAKYGLEDYVSYAQAREAERQAEGDPAKLAQRAERREAFQHVMAALDASGEIIGVGPDPRNEKRERFTTRSMATTEVHMEAAAAGLADRDGHRIKDKTREAVRKQTETEQGFDLSDEQRAALRHITGREDISLVVGIAGAGKSTMLNAARGVFEAEGYRVRGTALSGLAAKGLEDSAGIESGTLDQLLHRLDGDAERAAKVATKTAKLEAKIDSITGRSEKAQKYRSDLQRQCRDMKEDLEKGRLSKRDVIFVDEAAMIGSRKLDRLLTHAFEAGAKVVLVGDHEQVQAIEAGAAFRALMERHGAAMLKDVRRQSEEWQRNATKAFPDGRAREALNAYRDHGMTHESVSRDDAKAELIDAWARARQERPEDSSVIITHRNVDVHDLNQLARATYRAEGRLGEDREVEVKDGSITLAEGDRLLFRKNDGFLDVRNGSLGTVRKIEGEQITVALDTAKGKAGQGREVTFSTADYEEFTHGYAATVHKTQGATVDRAFVFATPGLDRHTAYVAMSRHRDRADLFYAREDFKGHDDMARRLSRDGMKDSVLDYTKRAENRQGFASGLRAAIASVWDKITTQFNRAGHHPAEAAERSRERAERAARRPGESFLDAVRGFAEKDRQAEAAKKRAERTPPPKVDPAFAKERVGPETERAKTDDTKGKEKGKGQQTAAERQQAEAAARREEIDRLRAAEARRRRENDPNGPAGRGG